MEIFIYNPSNFYIIPKRGDNILDNNPNMNLNEEINRLSIELQKEKQNHLQSKKRLDELNEVLKVINKILRHDLLNHLATVSMALEVYENKKDEKYIKSAFKGVHRGIELIRQMKELESLVETGFSLESIDLRAIINSVM